MLRIRSNISFKRFVVIGLMMASSLSFVEHVCHMDIARLLSLICCCEEQEGEMNHAGMHHDMDGMHAESEEDHHEHPPEHEDIPRHEGVMDACCSSAIQADVMPLLIRTADSGTTFLFVAIAVVSDLVAQPPALFNDSPRIIPWRTSLAPVYILYSVFLN